MHFRALVLCNADLVRKGLVRDLTQAKLAEFTFTETRNIGEALLKSDRFEFDMIFMEWEMSKELGLEFIRKIRARQKQHILMIAITSDASLGALQEAADNAGGVDYWVTRPFTAASLREKLEPFFAKLTAGPKMVRQQAFRT